MYSHGHTSTDTLGDVMEYDASPHEDRTAADHEGDATSEPIQFEDRHVSHHRGERNVVHDGHAADCPSCSPPVETTAENVRYHTSRKVPQEIHEGAREDCPECQPAPVPDPDQLCFAIATKTGTLVTRDGRPLWATRKLWSGLPELAAQIIPITGAPPIGSMPLMTDKAGPDVVGRLLELLDQLENQAAEGAKAIQVLGTIATKGAEGLENLSLIISQRIHFVELLDRAAAMIDPDSPAQLGGVTHEQRLDWLAKWREVVGR